MAHPHAAASATKAAAHHPTPATSSGPSAPVVLSLPEKRVNRKFTDVFFLNCWIIAVIILISFIIYCSILSDFARLKGYDECGNICGQSNKVLKGIPCSGQDYTNNTLLQVEETEDKRWKFHLYSRKCVESCEEGYVKKSTFCFKKPEKTDKEKPEELEEDDFVAFITEYAITFVLACLVSLCLTLTLFFLLKIITPVVVWTVLLLSGTAVVAAIWYEYYRIKTAEKPSSDGINVMVCGVIITLLWIFLLVYLFLVIRKIKVVTNILKAATDIIFDVPSVLFIPLAIIFMELLILGLFVYTSLIVYSSGILSEFNETSYYFRHNAAMQFTVVFNIIVTVWTLIILFELQYTITSGVIVTWYFAKDKYNLGSPILNSSFVVLKYHFGNVVFGSLFVHMFAVMRGVLTACTKRKMNDKSRCGKWINKIKLFLLAASRYAFIETAMRGKQFRPSGKKAAIVIVHNSMDIISMNYISDLIIIMAQLLVAVISWCFLIAYRTLHISTHVPSSTTVFIFVFVVTVCIPSSLFSALEATVDSILLCFCEDATVNDGKGHPFIMDPKLVESLRTYEKVKK